MRWFCTPWKGRILGANVLQHNYPSILLGSWMVFLIVLLSDPMFGSHPYSPYPRVKFCWSLLSIVVFSKSHYLTLLLRTSWIPFFGLHLFLTPLSLRQKGFYLFSPVVPGVIRLPHSNSNYFMESLSPLGWLQRKFTPESHISSYSCSGDHSVSLIP